MDDGMGIRAVQEWAGNSKDGINIPLDKYECCTPEKVSITSKSQTHQERSFERSKAEFQRRPLKFDRSEMACMYVQYKANAVSVRWNSLRYARSTSNVPRNKDVTESTGSQISVLGVRCRRLRLQTQLGTDKMYLCPVLGSGSVHLIAVSETYYMRPGFFHVLSI